MKCIPARYTIAILTSLGLALLYGLRININLAIVSMVNYTEHQNTSDGICMNITRRVQNKFAMGEYHWSNNLQGLILSSYYWGYLVVMLPGAILCELVSVKWVWFTAMILNVVPCLLIPISSDTHYVLVIIMRSVQGFGTGVVAPATSLILERWVPSPEENTIGALIYCGRTLGVVVIILLTGVIDVHLGWRAIFYITGSACIPWLLVWAIFVGDSPDKSKHISKEEIDFILSFQSEQTSGEKQLVILWKNIFTSMPFWALVITNGCGSWVMYLLITDLPIYMDKVFKLNLDAITMYIAIAVVSSWIYSIVLVNILEWVRKHINPSQSWETKSATLVSYVPVASVMVALAYVDCNLILGVVLTLLAFMLIWGNICGWISSPVDMGPKIAGTLMGMTSIVGIISGIAVPIFVGKILGDGNDLHSWFIIFWVGAAFTFVLLIVYTAFGSGELQNYYIEVDVPQTAPT